MNTLSSILTEKALDEAHKPFRRRHGQLTLGAVGCAMSHASLWRELVKSEEYEYAFIFEDDVHIPKHFYGFVNGLMDTIISKDIYFDMFLFSSYCPHQLEQKACVDSKETLFTFRNIEIAPFKIFWSLGGYVITKEGARKLLNRMFPLKDQLDTIITKLVLSHQFTVIGTNPSLINQQYSLYNSDIQQKCVECDYIEEMAEFLGS